MKAYLLALLIGVMPMQPSLLTDEIIDWEPMPNGMVLVHHEDISAYYNYNHDLSGLCPQPSVEGYVMLAPKGEGLQFCYQLYTDPVGYRTGPDAEGNYGFESFTTKTFKQ